jgi:tRNA G18 (ribose-2'-O)-methylase SpoU
MEPIAITAAEDARIADYVGLRDPDHRRRLEGDEFFVAEGVNVILRLLQSRYPLRSILLTPRRYERMADELQAVTCPIYVAEREVLASVAGFDLHRGAVASAQRLAPPSLDDVLAASRTIAVLEGLNDSENLGAIARSARGLGIDALVLDPACHDPFYRRTVRVSMGEVLFLPIARCTSWPADLERIAAAGFRLLALTPAASAVSIHGLTRHTDERVAVVLGAEGPGLSDAVLRRSERIRIPLRDGVDSLNVGHAAAIAFDAVSRERAAANDAPSTPATTA